ncbi:MAG: RNA pseudouridine synthase [Patescibacteria group bacterium]|mgnify:CR=1 FL=1
MSKVTCLYEDNHLIAVLKPAGIPVQGDETGDPCLLDEVKNFLKEKYQKPGNVFVGLLHRLDRPVTGIILFAKTSKGASRLSEQFRNHEVKKIYHAYVLGKPPKKSDTLIHYLKKDHEKNKVTAYEKQVPDSQYAELSYEVVPSKSQVTCHMLQVTLKTGRSHQIRVQLSKIGCPILGDLKYGAPSPLPDKSIALCATHLSFRTATTGEQIELAIDMPKIPG